MKDNDNVINVDFGTTDPNIKEVDEREEIEKIKMYKMFADIGQATYSDAVSSTKKEFIEYMCELYDILNGVESTKEKETSSILMPTKEIILPN